MNPVTLTARDQNDNGSIGTSQADTIGGFAVTSVWVGDTITVRIGNQNTTITGVTFYRAGAAAVFMPTDGTVLVASTFRSSTFVNTSTQFDLPPVPCFVAGTSLFTSKGARAVETLQPGDLLLTRDSGMRPVRWVGQVTVAGTSRFAPVRFMADTYGNTKPLLVSPNHRMLITGWRAEMYFGEREILVPAKALINGDTVRLAPCDRVTYVHLLLDRHEVIFAEGAATESLHPGDYLLAGASETRAEILALFPELRTDLGGSGWKTVRSVARTREAALLVA
ncbi:MAG: Hint domain-containing protein [Rhodobacterales bacterium]|nr:Hint domain-containing protein [Rhodobacterales bacterium]MDX5411651.1 Hint domain-containing protein [Rhodobacterales bacterium]